MSVEETLLSRINVIERSFHKLAMRGCLAPFAMFQPPKRQPHILEIREMLMETFKANRLKKGPGDVSVIDTEKTTPRAINLNTCEVWCPVEGRDVCVYDYCLAGESRDSCQFYERLHYMGRVICTWPDAGRD